MKNYFFTFTIYQEIENMYIFQLNFIILKDNGLLITDLIVITFAYKKIALKSLN